MKQVVVDLDPSEEIEETMDPHNLDEPEMQEMDTSKKEERRQDPMNTMVVVTSPDIKITPPPKDPTSAPGWLEVAVGKKWSVVLITIPMEDMVSRCLAKASKSKKLKT